MATRSVTTPANPELLKALQEAESALEDAVLSLSQLGALFRAIGDATTGQAKHLADLGHYCADDWCNTIDLVREQSIDPVMLKYTGPDVRGDLERMTKGQQFDEA